MVMRFKFAIRFASPVNSDVTSFTAELNRYHTDSDPVAIQSGGTGIGTVRTINFVGAGNSIKQIGDTVEISIAGGSGGSGVIHMTFNVYCESDNLDLANSTTPIRRCIVNGVRLSPSDFTETDST